LQRWSKMAAVLRIKLADLLMVMASDISLRPEGRTPKTGFVT
jgi:hypothetical protein